MMWKCAKAVEKIADAMPRYVSVTRSDTLLLGKSKGREARDPSLPTKK
jgi:hypothetical protein